MKKIAIIGIMFFLCVTVQAQEKTNDNFHKQELRISLGSPSLIYNLLLENDDKFYFAISFSYLYRPLKWLWFGVTTGNHLGNTIYYDWREYNNSGEFQDFSKSKTKYALSLTPEIRFSFINKTNFIMYTSFLSGGVWENNYNKTKLSQFRQYSHFTWLGFSSNFGKSKKVFLGGEFGIGMKGLFNFHGGYRL